MKTKHTKVVRSDEDFRAFLTECFCEGDTPKKNQYPTTVQEAKDWCENIRKKSPEEMNWPEKYPCLATFINEKIDDDNVGFGSYHALKTSFIYSEDLQDLIDGTDKIKAALNSVCT